MLRTPVRISLASSKMVLLCPLQVGLLTFLGYIRVSKEQDKKGKERISIKCRLPWHVHINPNLAEAQRRKINRHVRYVAKEWCWDFKPGFVS